MCKVDRLVCAPRLTVPEHRSRSLPASPDSEYQILRLQVPPCTWRVAPIEEDSLCIHHLFHIATSQLARSFHEFKANLGHSWTAVHHAISQAGVLDQRGRVRSISDFYSPSRLASTPKPSTGLLDCRRKAKRECPPIFSISATPSRFLPSGSLSQHIRRQWSATLTPSSSAFSVFIPWSRRDPDFIINTKILRQFRPSDCCPSLHRGRTSKLYDIFHLRSRMSRCTILWFAPCT